MQYYRIDPKKNDIKRILNKTFTDYHGFAPIHGLGMRFDKEMGFRPGFIMNEEQFDNLQKGSEGGKVRYYGTDGTYIHVENVKFFER